MTAIACNTDSTSDSELHENGMREANQSQSKNTIGAPISMSAQLVSVFPAPVGPVMQMIMANTAQPTYFRTDPHKSQINISFIKGMGVRT
jgi:hypothetical protein